MVAVLSESLHTSKMTFQIDRNSIMAIDVSIVCVPGVENASLLSLSASTSITRAEIQGLEDDFNSTLIFTVLTRSLRSTQYRLT